jgi:long-chain acyl-CoA synthetase
MSFNLATMLVESARATPDKAAWRFMGTKGSYRELDEVSDRVAANLMGRGLEPGDRVGVCLPNVPEFLYAYWGIMKAGLVMVPLNPLLKGPEIAYHLGDAGARSFIAYELFADQAAAGVADLDIETFLVPFLDSDATVPEAMVPFAQLTSSSGAPAGEMVLRNADDTAVLLYTSGTTGRPKGAELTHFQLYMNCTVAGEVFGVRIDDVGLAVLPFFHVFGLSSVLNLMVRYNGTMSIVPRFDAPAVLDAMESDGVSVFTGVPTMFQALLNEDYKSRNLSRLRIAVSGGAAMPGEVMRPFEDAFGIVILEGYGLSETASGATFNRSAHERKPMSVGKPLWGVDMQVRGDNDEVLAPGADHVGELVVRGHNVMKGYFGRPGDTAEAMRNGWFHTGDLGYVDSEGFYFIVDRKKDLVIRGGFNVYPRELEEVLLEHPGIAEVAVIGKPDARLGEEVVAVVAAAPGVTLDPDEVIAFAKERMAAYKYPREVRIVDSLPKGPTGKILKTELRHP